MRAPLVVDTIALPLTATGATDPIPTDGRRFIACHLEWPSTGDPVGTLQLQASNAPTLPWVDVSDVEIAVTDGGGTAHIAAEYVARHIRWRYVRDSGGDAAAPASLSVVLV
jgi:hypothetical protein